MERSRRADNANYGSGLSFRFALEIDSCYGALEISVIY